jgi:hypothetical protein
MVSASLADRIARLTYLCSEINKISKGVRVSTERLQEVMEEAESLSRVLRREINRRGRLKDRQAERRKPHRH